MTKYATRGYLVALKKVAKNSGRAKVTKGRLVCGEVHEERLHQPAPVRIIFPKATRS